MNFPVPCSVISEILGPYGPPVNVAKSWPLVEAALDTRAIYSPLCAVAAIATISAETRWFYPTRDPGGPVRLANLYENRRDLGNVNLGDGARFPARGFIPIIGRRSYGYFGTAIGKNLLGDPDLAMDPEIAAAILAIYFRDRGVPAAADQQHWRMARLRVNPTGIEWTRFFGVVLKLLEALDIPRKARSSRRFRPSNDCVRKSARHEDVGHLEEAEREENLRNSRALFHPANVRYGPETETKGTKRGDLGLAKPRKKADYEQR